MGIPKESPGVEGKNKQTPIPCVRLGTDVHKLESCFPPAYQVLVKIPDGCLSESDSGVGMESTVRSRSHVVSSEAVRRDILSGLRGRDARFNRSSEVHRGRATSQQPQQ